MQLSGELVSSLISDIYDCAVDPSLWKPTLTRLRDMMQLSYMQVYMTSPPGSASGRLLSQTDWDQDWLAALQPLVPAFPAFRQMHASGLDAPQSALQLMDEAEFRKSGFFLEWCAPQALLDGCFTKFVARGDCDAWLTAIASERRGAINDNDRHLLQVLSPHLRRSLLISDLLRQQEERQAVFKQVLNRLSVPVMLVDRDARLVHANRAAEDILASDGPLTEVSGRLWSRHQPQRDALHHAISIACTQPDGRLGTLGNGIVLTGPQETFAAAYVLPLGVSDHRRALGPGNAAVFTTSKSGAKPPPVEVLSAVSGLTIAEARVSLAISDGTSTEAIAATLGISIHTLRKHLANVYDKTGLGNQAALAAFVNRLRTPLH